MARAAICSSFIGRIFKEKLLPGRIRPSKLRHTLCILKTSLWCLEKKVGCPRFFFHLFTQNWNLPFSFSLKNYWNLRKQKFNYSTNKSGVIKKKKIMAQHTNIKTASSNNLHSLESALILPSKWIKNIFIRKIKKWADKNLTNSILRMKANKNIAPCPGLLLCGLLQKYKSKTKKFISNLRLPFCIYVDTDFCDVVWNNFLSD